VQYKWKILVLLVSWKRAVMEDPCIVRKLATVELFSNVWRNCFVEGDISLSGIGNS
jgi:hypothetical protein